MTQGWFASGPGMGLACQRSGANMSANEGGKRKGKVLSSRKIILEGKHAPSLGSAAVFRK